MRCRRRLLLRVPADGAGEPLTGLSRAPAPGRRSPSVYGPHASQIRDHFPTESAAWRFPPRILLGVPSARELEERRHLLESYLQSAFDCPAVADCVELRSMLGLVDCVRPRGAATGAGDAADPISTPASWSSTKHCRLACAAPSSDAVVRSALRRVSIVADGCS